MNVYDSDRMAEILAPLGYTLSDENEAADMVILNTCHIREKADEKVYSELGRLRLVKNRKANQGKNMILAVAGCVAQAESAEMLRRAPFIDIIFGPQTYHRLPEMVAQATRINGTVLDINFPTEIKFDSLPKSSKTDRVSVFLPVQEGCNRFCTFCVVPYTRGAEYSRPESDILAEACRLVTAGAREIILLGQNVNAYHGSIDGLGGLIRRLAEIDGLLRIRYMTSHPIDMDDSLITAHSEVPQLMPFLHLPIQSGSDRVLTAMNRKHKVADYRILVEKLRTARSDMALSSDFIVGFPGETKKDFHDTLTLIEEISFIHSYSFKYSIRPGTPAANIKDQVSEDQKNARLIELQKTLTTQQQAFNKSCIGSMMPVLLDSPGRFPGQLTGRSPYMQPIYVNAPADFMGRVIQLKITNGSSNSLSGTLPEMEKIHIK